MTPEQRKGFADAMAGYYFNPYAFVCDVFPWGVKGTPVEHFAGPKDWQKEVLLALGRELEERCFDGHTPVLPIYIAVASGHGIGKSALSAWIILWFTCTRTIPKGTVTANTATQLSSRTWGEVGKWHRMNSCLESFLKYKNSRAEMSIYNPDSKSNWKVDAFTARKENSESFAGQHNVTSSSLYLFDEASAVDKEIYEVAKGGLTDGEPIFILFGNPTRSTGDFRKCFKAKSDWLTWKVDARSVEGANMSLFNQWIEEYGEDSDFVRIRVRGEFPKASVDQLIPEPVIDAAMARVTRPAEYESLPVTFGLDISGSGDDKTVLWMKQGTIAQELFAEVELNEVDDIVDKVLSFARIHNPDTVFVDITGVGWGTFTVLKKYVRCVGINFAQKSSDPQYFNIRSEGYHRLRDWLKQGGDIPHDDEKLKEELEAIEYFQAGNGKVQLIDKKMIKRLLERSPDKADALMLCCVRDVTPVNIPAINKNRDRRRGRRSRIYGKTG